MTDNASDSTKSTVENQDIPQVVIRPSYRFRLIWLVPIVAVLVGIWLTVKSSIEAGPTITITFESAEGLQAGKTKIKYKDVEIGQVESIHLSRNLSGVIVTAKMVKEIKPHLSENTRFWVVRARLAAGEVSGIGTLLSGAYIGMDPGGPGRYAEHFNGLEIAPVVTLDMPGSYYNLRADRLGSLDIGSPVYFHQIKVGQVVSYAIDERGTALDIQIFIRAPHNQRVLENTRFWNASGFEVSLDSSGLRLNTDSLVSLLLGGVAFETPLNEIPGTVAAEGRQFYLFASRDKTKEPSYSQKMYMMAYFDGSVRGLTKGANVEFRGIKVGEVVDIELEFNPDRLSFNIPVLLIIEPERLSINGTAQMAPEDIMLKLIEKGLQAQLRNGMLITGQLYVNLALTSEVPENEVKYVGGYPVIPTVAGPTEEIMSSLSNFLNRLEDLPLEQIGGDLKESVHGMRLLLASRDLNASLPLLRQSLEQINSFTATLNNQTAPQLSSVLDEAGTTLVGIQSMLQTAENVLDSDTPLMVELSVMIEELARAGKAVSALADYLERHPEALIFGKGAPKP